MVGASTAENQKNAFLPRLLYLCGATEYGSSRCGERFPRKLAAFTKPSTFSRGTDRPQISRHASCFGHQYARERLSDQIGSRPFEANPSRHESCRFRGAASYSLERGLSPSSRNLVVPSFLTRDSLIHHSSSKSTSRPFIIIRLAPLPTPNFPLPSTEKPPFQSLHLRRMSTARYGSTSSVGFSYRGQILSACPSLAKSHRALPQRVQRCVPRNGSTCAPFMSHQKAAVQSTTAAILLNGLRKPSPLHGSFRAG